MDIYSNTDLAILQHLGQKLKDIRLDKSITQASLAEMSGVSIRRISDIESGRNCSLIILIQLLRGLNSLDLLALFFAQREVSPIWYAKMQSRLRPKRRTRIYDPPVRDDEEEELW